MQKIVLFVLTAALLFGTSPALAFTDEVNMTASQYVQVLKALPLSDTPHLAKLRDRLANYYLKARITKTIRCDGYIIDCIPFDQQPTLLSADSSTIKAAQTANMRYRGGARTTELAFDTSQCPPVPSRLSVHAWKNSSIPVQYTALEQISVTNSQIHGCYRSNQLHLITINILQNKH